MPRPTSVAFAQAAAAQQTGEVLVILLTLDADSLPAPIRVNSAGASLISRGNTFLRFPFEITMPKETDEAPPSVTLRICNVDRQIVEAVRTTQGAITVTVEIVLASSLDTVECGPLDFTLRDVNYDSFVVEGELAYEDILNEPCPAHQYTNTNFSVM